MSAHHYRAEMTVRFEIWEQITGTTGLSTTA
jgi:putative transposase